MKLTIPICSVFLALVTIALAQQRPGRLEKEFMRAKLELSQKALEGITTENWELVVANAEKLSAMTRDAKWRSFQNPEYDQQSQLFRQNVETLARAAKKKNVDAATLGYVRMTISCVDCHKVVRGKVVASLR